ncbi:hypothetical protein [Streptomyces zaomyceticus]|uniref:hypothetical protein n=1 Tax=Streptomyces zaomyceticus TaxID=68286 RepID=UPI0037A60CC7
MGVFAMFRRKKKGAAVVPSEETGATAPAEDGDTDTASDAPEALTIEAAEGTAEAAEDTADTEVAGVAGAKGADGVDDDQGDEVTGAAAAEAVEAVEAVEIPKQQSAEAAADNEAGESARR